MFIQAETRSQSVKQEAFIASLYSIQAALIALSSFLFRSLFLQKTEKGEYN